MGGQDTMFRLVYECLHCGKVWTQAWDSIVNDKCDCGREIQPYHVEELEDE